MLKHPHLTTSKLATAVMAALGTLGAIELMGWQSKALYILGGPVGAVGFPVSAVVSILAIIPPLQGRARPVKNVIGVMLTSLALVALALWFIARGTAPRLGTGLISALAGWGVWMYATLPDHIETDSPAPRDDQRENEGGHTHPKR